MLEVFSAWISHWCAVFHWTRIPIEDWLSKDLSHAWIYQRTSSVLKTFVWSWERRWDINRSYTMMHSAIAYFVITTGIITDLDYFGDVILNDLSSKIVERGSYQVLQGGWDLFFGVEQWLISIEYDSGGGEYSNLSIFVVDRFLDVYIIIMLIVEYRQC